MRILALFVLLAFTSTAFAESRIELKDGTVVFGKILSLAEGEDLVVDTEHMDDVTIEWDSIVSIEATRVVSVQLFDGTRISGTLYLDQEGLRVGGEAGELIDMRRVFEIDEYNQSVWEGVEIYTDLGMNIVRGNSTVTQVSTGAGISYDGPKFETSLDATTLINEQTDAEDTRRATLGFNYTWKLQDNWTVTGVYSLESDEQQGLEARSLAGAAVGKRVVNNRRFRWTFDVGAALNIEDFEEQDQNETLEGLLATGIRWRSKHDVDLDATLIAFPSLEQSDRWRAQFDTSLSVDLWGDLDFKLTGYARFDTEPPEANEKLDWGTTVGLSWKYD